MNLGFHMLFALCAMSLSGVSFAQTNWQDFMPNLLPGLSTSPVPAILPPDIVIEPPTSELPADKARWSGRWRGWACRDQVCDTRLVVEKVRADGATIVYAFASETQKPYAVHIEAKFVGDELQGTLPSGATIAYRIRKSGDLEFHRQWKTSWATGILSRDNEDLALKAEAIRTARTAKPGPDVPESCARFFGGWTGRWQYDEGPQRLWVLGVKADCTAQYSHRNTSSDAVPGSLLPTEIKGGTLTSPCGAGTCTFTTDGDTVFAIFDGHYSGRPNRGVFQKIK
jgi:hypothetical protein